MSIFDETGGESELSPSAETEATAEVHESSPAETVAEPIETPETGEQGEAAVEAPTTEATEATPPTEDEIATLEKEVETALSDERTPKWFKNAVDKVYKPKLQSLTEQLGSYEPLAQFGAVEEINDKLNLLKGLETKRANPNTGMPERSTEPFVKGLYEKDRETAYQLMSDLANLPSPHTEGYTVLQELFSKTGIDPSRLDDIKTFAANGYQLQTGQYPPPSADDLELIPQHLQATFASMSPERRDALLYLDDNVRDASLEDARTAAEAKRTQELSAKTEAETKASQEQAQQEQFKQVVDQKGLEHYQQSGNAVLTSFVDSLAKQANMTPMDSQMIANLVINSFEPTLLGQKSLEVLKSEGIVPDPAIPQTLAQMEENARFIAYYEATGEKAEYERHVARQVELQERVIGKSNKIIAALAQKKAQNAAQTISTQNNLLAQTQNQRYATAGTGAQIGTSNGTTSDDFSDEGYLENLRAGGFGQRR
jgi:hypothetical protein